MFRLSKNILYAGIVLLVFSLVYRWLWNTYSATLFDGSFTITLMDTVFNAFMSILCTLLIMRILIEIKLTHSFTVWYIIFMVAHVAMSFFIIFLRFNRSDLNFDNYSTYISIIGALQSIPILIIIIKLYLLKGSLSGWLKTYASFMLVSLLTTPLTVFLYRIYSVSEMQLTMFWMHTGFELIRVIVLGGLFYKSAQYLEQPTDNTDDILDSLLKKTP